MNMGTWETETSKFTLVRSIHPSYEYIITPFKNFQWFPSDHRTMSKYLSLAQSSSLFPTLSSCLFLHTKCFSQIGLPIFHFSKISPWAHCSELFFLNPFLPMNGIYPQCLLYRHSSLGWGYLTFKAPLVTNEMLPLIHCLLLSPTSSTHHMHTNTHIHTNILPITPLQCGPEDDKTGY